jgi:3-deoxy-D-manno-octulosonate 8-phosphate phosphatase (KDO 8-P phosphatase)
MAAMDASEFAMRARAIEWILCDVDGVLTDGGLYYDHRGRQTLRFNVKDGMGLKLAQRAGIKVGLLTARETGAIRHRAKELHLDAAMTGIRDKGVRFAEFLEEKSCTANRVAYVGDDLADLAVLGRCGLTFCPSDAVAEVRAVVHRVLSTAGGRGAAREMVERILKARGAWEEILAPFGFEHR